MSRTILCRGLFCVQDCFVSRTILCRGLFCVPVAILAPKSLFTQFHFFLLSSDLMERSYGSNPTVLDLTRWVLAISPKLTASDFVVLLGNSTVLRMGLPIVENLSGLRGNVFSLD